MPGFVPEFLFSQDGRKAETRCMVGDEAPLCRRPSSPVEEAASGGIRGRGLGDGRAEGGSPAAPSCDRCVGRRWRQRWWRCCVGRERRAGGCRELEEFKYEAGDGEWKSKRRRDTSPWGPEY